MANKVATRREFAETVRKRWFGQVRRWSNTERALTVDEHGYIRVEGTREPVGELYLSGNTFDAVKGCIKGCCVVIRGGAK